MSAPPPPAWDALSALVPPPSKLAPCEAELSARLPAQFCAAVHSRHAAHVAALEAAAPAAPPFSVAPLSHALRTLLPHFRRLMASPDKLRDALRGAAQGEAVAVSDPRAREALRTLLPRLAAFSELRAGERAAWLAGMDLEKGVVEAGVGDAEKVLALLEKVFADIKTSVDKLDTYQSCDT